MVKITLQASAIVLAVSLVALVSFSAGATAGATGETTGESGPDSDSRHSGCGRAKNSRTAGAQSNRLDYTGSPVPVKALAGIRSGAWQMNLGRDSYLAPQCAGGLLRMAWERIPARRTVRERILAPAYPT